MNGAAVDLDGCSVVDRNDVGLIAMLWLGVLATALSLTEEALEGFGEEYCCALRRNDVREMLWLRLLV